MAPGDRGVFSRRKSPSESFQTFAEHEQQRIFLQRIELAFHTVRKFRPVDQEFDKRDGAAWPTSGWRGEAVGNLWANGKCPLDWPVCFRDDVIAEGLSWPIR